MRLPEPCLGRDHPVNLLRELAGGLEALSASPGCDGRLRDLVRFLLGALARYDDLAPSGLTIDQALGLKRAGPASWWRQERLAHRDRLLREIAARHYAGLDAGAAAAAIIRDAAQLSRQRNPPPDSLAADLARAALAAPIPGSLKAVRAILGN